MKVMYANVYRREDILVAACDKEIIGKTFTQGDKCINVSKNFYCGELMPVLNLSDMLSEATIANLTGNNVVDYALSLKCVDEQHVIEISGIKHAQVILLLDQ